MQLDPKLNVKACPTHLKAVEDEARPHGEAHKGDWPVTMAALQQ